MKNVVVCKKTKCDLYFAHVWVIAARDPVKARTEMKKTFGDYNGSGFHACHSYSGSNYGLFLPTKELTHGDIGHELFHCTCRILEDCADVLTPDRHEPHAYLNGWLHNLVYGVLKGRVRITTERPI